MPTRNLIMDIKLKIDNIALDYESKVNKDENDIKMLSHIQRTRSTLEEVLKKIKSRIPKMDKSELSKIKADLNYLAHELNSNKYTDAKKIILTEQKLESLNEEYEKIIYESRTLEEKILAVKEKKELEKKQEQELKDKINSNIARIMEKKANRKAEEIKEQRERENRISSVVNRVKLEKAKERTNVINAEVPSKEKISVEKDNIVKGSIDENKTEKETVRELGKIKEHKKESISESDKVKKYKKESISFIAKIKNKIKSVRDKGNEKAKRKLPWFIAIPLGTVFAISFVNSTQVKESTDGLKDNKNSYIDNELSTENNGEYKTGNSIEDRIVGFERKSWEDGVYGPQNSQLENSDRKVWRPVIDDNYNMDNKSDNNTSIEIGKENDTNDINVVDINTENSADESNKDAIQEKNLVVNIGDKIKVKDGLKYTETCYGEGNVGYIGAVSWRPATEYSIERVAFSYNNQVIGLTDENTISINDDLNKYAKQYNVDIDQIQTKVLLSLIPGSYDTGWADITINDIQKDSVKYDFSDSANQNINKTYNEIER